MPGAVAPSAPPLHTTDYQAVLKQSSAIADSTPVNNFAWFTSRHVVLEPSSPIRWSIRLQILGLPVSGQIISVVDSHLMCL